MNKLDIYSDKGTYELVFNETHENIQKQIDIAPVVIIDSVVLGLYKDTYTFDMNKIIEIDAQEEKKTPKKSLEICEQLMLKGIRRKDTILAIGGGITQDLVTFATSILFRGVNWVWMPTTLLAQADSCIGGKSSLNYKTWKNILGNFYPPSKIYVQEKFLETLHNDDIRSGIGEILKVHLLSGKKSSDDILKQMNQFETDKTILSTMILNSLKHKNKILKIDALDTGLRLKMNYGHSFGHALESATNFGIPHGIAVTIGLDMANFMALQIENISEEHFNTLHNALRKNLETKDFASFDFLNFISALKKDKKNDAENYNLVIPVADGEVELISFVMNDTTENMFQNYFEQYYK